MASTSTAGKTRYLPLIDEESSSQSMSSLGSLRQAVVSSSPAFFQRLYHKRHVSFAHLLSSSSLPPTHITYSPQDKFDSVIGGTILILLILTFSGILALSFAHRSSPVPPSLSLDDLVNSSFAPFTVRSIFFSPSFFFPPFSFLLSPTSNSDRAVLVEFKHLFMVGPIEERPVDKLFLRRTTFHNSAWAQ